MQSLATTAHRPRAVSGRVAPAFQSLIRSITAQTPPADPAQPSQTTDRGPDEVIIDAEIDGVRYRLVRLQEPQAPMAVSFSPRESEIARMVAKGYPNKMIAAVLEISPWTVCTHLRRMFAKLGVSSRAAMVARFIKENILGDLG